MQNGNGHKCLPATDKADKVIYGSSEVLANIVQDIIMLDKLSTITHCKFVITTVLILTILTRMSKFYFTQFSYYCLL